MTAFDYFIYKSRGIHLKRHLMVLTHMTIMNSKTKLMFFTIFYNDWFHLKINLMVLTIFENDLTNFTRKEFWWFWPICLSWILFEMNFMPITHVSIKFFFEWNSSWLYGLKLSMIKIGWIYPWVKSSMVQMGQK